MTEPLQFDFRSAAEKARDNVRELLGGARLGPWPLPKMWTGLLHRLLDHVGQGAPVQLEELVRVTGLDERAIKAAMKSLVEDFDVPIGASREKPYGYFLVASAADAELAARPYLNEAFSLLRRAHKLKKSRRVAEMLGQLQAELEESA